MRRALTRLLDRVARPARHRFARRSPRACGLGRFELAALTIAARSGIGVLEAHPRLYASDDCPPRRPLLSLGGPPVTSVHAERLLTTACEQADWSPLLALPGRKHLGLARSLHAASSLAWLGAVAARLTRVLRARHPRPVAVAHAAVSALLVPALVATGVAHAPARLAGLGGRQRARALHLALGAAVALVALSDRAARLLAPRAARAKDEADVTFTFVAGLLAAHASLSLLSLHAPRATARVLHHLLAPLAWRPRASRAPELADEAISPFFRVKGAPPIAAYPAARGDDPTYERLLANGFRDFRLAIDGRCERPLALSLDELRALPRSSLVARHVAAEGWSAVARFAGVPIAEILELARPAPDARYLVLHAFGLHEPSGRPFYECIRLDDARDPQAILADEMNGVPLPIAHGAPLRVRLPRARGFKMVKWLRRIELVADHRHIGRGRGGVREDEEQYEFDDPL